MLMANAPLRGPIWSPIWSQTRVGNLLPIYRVAEDQLNRRVVAVRCHPDVTYLRLIDFVVQTAAFDRTSQVSGVELWNTDTGAQ